VVDADSFVRQLTRCLNRRSGNAKCIPVYRLTDTITITVIIMIIIIIVIVIIIIIIIIISGKWFRFENSTYLSVSAVHNNYD